MGSLAPGGTAAAEEVARPRCRDQDQGQQASSVRWSRDGRWSASSLQIVNKTDPDRIGPHTFTLFDAGELPRGRDEIKRCGKIKGLCKRVANDHGVFPPDDFEVDDPVVENGSAGWDTSYEGGTSGDSWFTQTEDETTSRQLTAAPGNLRFLCIVHPDMQGKVKVLP